MTSNNKPTSPLKAIRQNCVECCGGILEVKNCTVTKCPLFEFRFGKNPYITPRQLTDEQKTANVERLRKWREQQLKDKEAKAYEQR